MNSKLRRDRVSSFLSDFEFGPPARPTRTSWLSERLRAWGVSLGRGPAPADSDADTALSTRLQGVFANPAMRDRLRIRLSERCGSQNVEFLFGYWAFSRSGNALERYQQLRVIMHAFVRDGADRPVNLKDTSRRRLLHDWERWSRGTRVPPGVRLAGLDAAAAEVERMVLSARGSLLAAQDDRER